MTLKSLPLRNLVKKPARTAALLLLVIFLCFAVFGGAMVVLSLRNGLSSLEARLGADVIAVPSSAKSKVDLNNLFLQGTTGYYYMDRSYYDKIAGCEGIETLSPQVFLASLRADCCSVPVQVIGIDPETDFTVQPWIEESYHRELGEHEIVVGCKVNVSVGETLRIYGTGNKAVAKLAPTGTGLDTAVYCSMDTMALLLQAARDLGHDLKIGGDPAQVVSAVYIKVKDGTSVESVVNDINLHVKKVQAVQTRSMLTGVSDSLSAVAGTVTALIAAVWALMLIILTIAFSMLVRERKREFAALRVMGFSRKQLRGMVLKEAVMIALAGGVCGIALGALVVFPFSALLEQRLGLPYLLPGAGQLTALAGLTLSAALLAAPLSSAWAAGKLSRVDTGAILREGA